MPPSPPSTAAGGEIVERPRRPIPGGRRFTFTDPSGNELGVFQDRLRPGSVRGPRLRRAGRDQGRARRLLERDAARPAGVLDLVRRHARRRRRASASSTIARGPQRPGRPAAQQRPGPRAAAPPSVRAGAGPSARRRPRAATAPRRGRPARRRSSVSAEPQRRGRPRRRPAPAAAGRRARRQVTAAVHLVRAPARVPASATTTAAPASSAAALKAGGPPSPSGSPSTGSASPAPVAPRAPERPASRSSQPPATLAGVAAAASSTRSVTTWPRSHAVLHQATSAGVGKSVRHGRATLPVERPSDHVVPR